MSKTVTFLQASRFADWVLMPTVEYREEGFVRICEGGLAEYLEIPVDIHELNVTFHTTRPAGNNYFGFTRSNQALEGAIGLRTTDVITWHNSASRYMRYVYDEGYRYLTVEY